MFSDTFYDAIYRAHSCKGNDVIFIWRHYWQHFSSRISWDVPSAHPLFYEVQNQHICSSYLLLKITFSCRSFFPLNRIGFPWRWPQRSKYFNELFSTIATANANGGEHFMLVKVWGFTSHNIFWRNSCSCFIRNYPGLICLIRSRVPLIICP